MSLQKLGKKDFVRICPSIYELPIYDLYLLLIVRTTFSLQQGTNCRPTAEPPLR